MCYFERIQPLSYFCTKLLLSLCLLTAVNTQAATYNLESGELHLPFLINGSKTLTDVTIKLSSDGTYQITKSTESTQPYLCPDKFDQTTMDLVKTVDNSSQVDSLLKCNWNLQTTSLTYASEDRPAIRSVSSSWHNSTCSKILVSIGEFSGNTSTSVSLQENRLGCNINTEFSLTNLYNLQSNAFLMNAVIINDKTLATEVFLKFDDKNKYQLIHFSVPEQKGLPVVCRTLTTDDFDAISEEMGPNDINKLFNCQWQTTRISESSNIPYTWADHECNEISIVEGQNKSFLNRRTGGCGTYNAH